MTSPLVIPASVSTNGTVRAVFMPSVADLADPTMNEVEAVGSLDFSCYATGDGISAETSETNVDDPRLCSKAVYEAPGDRTDTLEITYIFGPASPSNNEAHLELTEGRVGFIGLRWAVDAEEPWAADDIIDVYPVTLGAQRKNNPTRNSIHRITQKCFVTGRVSKDVVLSGVAGPPSGAFALTGDSTVITGDDTATGMSYSSGVLTVDDAVVSGVSYASDVLTVTI